MREDRMALLLLLIAAVCVGVVVGAVGLWVIPTVVW